MDQSPHRETDENFSRFLAEQPDMHIILRPNDVALTHQGEREAVDPTLSASIPSISASSEAAPEVATVIPIEMSALVLHATPPEKLEEATPQTENDQDADAGNTAVSSDKPFSVPQVDADTNAEKPPETNDTPPSPPPPETPFGGDIFGGDEDPDDSEGRPSRADQLQFEETYKETIETIETQLEHAKEAITTATSPHQLDELDIDGIIHEVAATVLSGVEELAPQIVSLAENSRPHTQTLTKAYMAATFAGDIPTSLAAEKKLHGLLHSERTAIEESNAVRAPQWLSQKGALQTLVTLCAEHNASAEPWIKLYSVSPADYADLTLQYHTLRYMIHGKNDDAHGVRRLEEAVEISLEQIDPSSRDIFQRITALPIVQNPQLRMHILEDFVAQASATFIDTGLAHRTINIGIALLKDSEISSDLVEILDRAITICELDPESMPMSRWQVALEAHRNPDAEHLIAYINRSKQEAMEATQQTHPLPETSASQLSLQELAGMIQLFDNRADNQLEMLVTSSIQDNNVARAIAFLSHIKSDTLRFKATLQCLEAIDSREQLMLLSSKMGGNSSPSLAFLLNIGASLLDRNTSAVMGYMQDIISMLTASGPQILPSAFVPKVAEYIISNLERVNTILAKRALTMFEDAIFQASQDGYFSRKYTLGPKSHAAASARLSRIRQSPMTTADKLTLTLELAAKLSVVRQLFRSN